MTTTPYDGKSNLRACGTCNGTGKVKSSQGTTVCPSCNGSLIDTGRKDFDRATQRGEIVTK